MGEVGLQKRFSTDKVVALEIRSGRTFCAQETAERAAQGCLCGVDIEDTEAGQRGTETKSSRSTWEELCRALKAKTRSLGGRVA